MAANTSMDRGARLLGALLVLGGLCATSPAAADAGIGVFVDDNQFVLGSDLRQISVSGFNTGGPVTVDVHVGLISPTGDIFEYPDWNNNLDPWLESFSVPEGFTYPTTRVFAASGIPGDLTPGIWVAAAALTEPGTLNIIALDTAPFAVIEETGSGHKLGSVIFHQQQTTSGVELSAQGVFLETSGDFETLLPPAEWPAIEQCVLNESFNTPPGQPLDAGAALALSSNQASAPIPEDPQLAQIGIHIYGSLEGRLSSDFYQAGDVYTFQGSGGTQIGPFSTSLRAPLPLTLSQPALSELASHDAATDLELVWNGNNGVGYVQANLGGFLFVSPNSATEYRVTCLFADDGRAAIPAPRLIQLRDLLLSGELAIPGVSNIAELQVMRFEYTMFNTTRGELSHGEAGIQSSTSMSLLLE